MGSEYDVKTKLTLDAAAAKKDAAAYAKRIDNLEKSLDSTKQTTIELQKATQVSAGAALGYQKRIKSLGGALSGAKTKKKALADATREATKASRAAAAAARKEASATKKAAAVAAAAAISYKKRLLGLGAQIKGTKMATGGLLRQVLLVGSADMGLNAGIRIFSSLTGSAIEYTQSLESTKIGLASVLAAVNHLSYGAAKLQANKAFGIIKELSVTSPAGPKEMFNIFQSVVGPLRAAGTEMGRIYKMTSSTVLASGALGIDLPQAARDMALMVRGSAGMDTRMFAILRSMNLITESTEEWNKQLTAAERVEKLEKALALFGESGGAFAKSFAGVTSTFKGLFSEMKRGIVSPILDAFAGKLLKLNNYLTENNDAILSTLHAYGEQAGRTLAKAADYGVAAFKKLQANWSGIVSRFHDAMAMAKKYGPMLAKIGGGAVALEMAKGPIGSAVGGAMFASNALVGGTGKTKGATKAAKGMKGATKAAKGMLAARGLGLPMAAGLMAAGATSGSAGAGAGGAAVAATGAGAGGAGVAATGAAAAILPIVAALAALAAVGMAVWKNFDLLYSVFLRSNVSVGKLTDRIIKLGKNIWSFLSPALEAIGLLIVAGLVPDFMALKWVFESVMLPMLELFGSFLSDIGYILENDVIPALQSFIGWIGNIRNATADESDHEVDYSKKIDIPILQMMDERAVKPKKTNGMRTPKTRQGTNINVDKMIIKQEFKGAKDPDRVVQMMLKDITRQSEIRVNARFTGALTR